jgi:hypothetical protein
MLFMRRVLSDRAFDATLRMMERQMTKPNPLPVESLPAE